MEAKYHKQKHHWIKLLFPLRLVKARTVFQKEGFKRQGTWVHQ